MISIRTEYVLCSSSNVRDAKRRAQESFDPEPDSVFWFQDERAIEVMRKHVERTSFREPGKEHSFRTEDVSVIADSEKIHLVFRPERMMPYRAVKTPGGSVMLLNPEEDAFDRVDFKRSPLVVPGPTDGDDDLYIYRQALCLRKDDGGQDSKWFEVSLTKDGLFVEDGDQVYGITIARDSESVEWLADIASEKLIERREAIRSALPDLLPSEVSDKIASLTIDGESVEDVLRIYATQKRSE